VSLIEGFRHTPAMTDAIERIHRSKDLLELHLDEAEPFHGAIRRQVMASVVHYSTKIEGNRLTREQVEAIIAGDAIEAPEKDRVEATNYFQAMKWAQTRAADPDWRMTHETILTLHFLIGQNLGEDYQPLGRYRQRQNTVSDRRTGSVIYWPPRPDDVPGVMDEFVRWCRQAPGAGLDPYILNALAHLNFVAVHPFSDGNGRVARVICSLLMMRDGYRAQAFYSLEEYFGVHWRDYASEIEQCLGPRWDPDRIDATSWVEWYLNAVATQVADAEQLLRRALTTLGIIHLGLNLDGRARPRGALALWLAFRDGQVTNRSLRTAMAVSQKTASDELRALTQAGYLLVEGRGRGAKYVPGPKARDWGDLDTLVSLADEQGMDAVRTRLNARGQMLF
jgi:Fic family protein